MGNPTEFEVSPETAELQAEIQDSFIKVSAKASNFAVPNLVLRKDVDPATQTHWLERGAIVALETPYEIGRIDELMQKIEDIPTSVIETISRVADIPVERIVGDDRRQDVILPRHVAMYLLRKHTKLSYSEMGKAFDRDHTSVIHAVEKISTILQGGYSADKLAVSELLKRVEAEVAGRVKSLYEEEFEADVGGKTVEAVAVTREGLYSYPANQIRNLYAVALRVKLDSLVLDYTNRLLSDQLLQAYGSTTLSLLDGLMPRPKD